MYREFFEKRQGIEKHLRSVRDDWNVNGDVAEYLDKVSALFSAMIEIPWVGVAAASKIMHRKRPKLIPVMDNMAIIDGPYESKKRDKDLETVEAVMSSIWSDVKKPGNKRLLEGIADSLIKGRHHDTYTPIRVFDIILWEDFRYITRVVNAIVGNHRFRSLHELGEEELEGLRIQTGYSRNQIQECVENCIDLLEGYERKASAKDRELFVTAGCQRLHIPDRFHVQYIGGIKLLTDSMCD